MMTDEQKNHELGAVLPTAVENYMAERLILDLRKWIEQESARRRRDGDHTSADAIEFVGAFINKQLQENQLASNAVGKIESALLGAESRAGQWPWGTHETELLRKLAGAANKFWVLYDPDDPTSAPTNKQVIEWLEKERVSNRTAEYIATILRADGLRKGPRK